MKPAAPATASAKEPQSRYPGTRPFRDDARDARLFFGRDEEGEQLFLRVLSVPFVVQFGRSGLGKTSLLQASLLPRLRERAFLPVLVRLNNLADSAFDAATRSIREACAAAALDLTEGSGTSLADWLDGTVIWRDELLLTPVLVFDQFEEVFTLRDPAFRAALADELGKLATRTVAKVVISLREDYLGALEEFASAVPGLFHERLRLEPMTETAAREAITVPARLEMDADGNAAAAWTPRFEFEPEALDRIVAYLKGSSGVIEPFQLQLLARHAEAIAAAKAHRTGAPVRLALTDFDGATDFDNVLGRFYLRTLEMLEAPQRRRARELCEDGLLDVSGHRLMLEEGQIRQDFGVTDPALQTLTRERLLRRERRMESVFYEISHDRLAESIREERLFRLPKRLRRRLWTAAIVAPVVVAGLLVWSLSLRAERQKAEDLLGFLLGERFLGEVRDSGRYVLLEQVRERAHDLLGPNEHNTTVARGLALRNDGDIRRNDGALLEATALFDAAQRIFLLHPREPDAVRESARTYDRMADGAVDRGGLTEAASYYDASVRAWRQLLADRPPAAAAALGAASAPADKAARSAFALDCAGLANALVSAAELHFRVGNIEAAIDVLDEAADISVGLLVGGRPRGMSGCEGAVELAAPQPDPVALNALSRAVLLRAQVFDTRRDYEAAATLADEARRLRPQSFSMLKDSVVARAMRGNGRMTNDSSRSALEDYRAALSRADRLTPWNADSRQWRRERSVVQLLLAEAILSACQERTDTAPPKASDDCGDRDLAEAEIRILDSTAALRTLAQRDPANLSLQRDLAWAFQDRALVFEARKQPAPQRAWLEKSLAQLGDCGPGRIDAECAQTRAALLSKHSAVLAQQGDPAKARASSQRAVELMVVFVDAHPTHWGLVSSLKNYRQQHAALLRQAGDAAGAAAIERVMSDPAKQGASLLKSQRSVAQAKVSATVDTVNEGARLFNAGQHTQALLKFQVAEGTARDAVMHGPSSADAYSQVRNIQRWLVRTHEALGRDAPQDAPLSAAMRAARLADLLADKGDSANMHELLRQARQEFGLHLDAVKRFDDALAIVQEEIAVAQALVQSNVNELDRLHLLANANGGMATVLRHAGKLGWEESVRGALVDLDIATRGEPRNAVYLKETAVWHGFLAGELVADQREDEATAHYRAALDAYQRTDALKPGDDDVAKAIKALTERVAKKR
jgi:hypothetical protein